MTEKKNKSTPSKIVFEARVVTPETIAQDAIDAEKLKKYIEEYEEKCTKDQHASRHQIDKVYGPGPDFEDAPFNI